MLDIALLIAGAVIGGLCTGLVVGSRLRQKHSQEILQIQAEHNNLLNDAKGRIKASEAIKGSNEAFLRLDNEHLLPPSDDDRHLNPQ